MHPLPMPPHTHMEEDDSSERFKDEEMTQVRVVVNGLSRIKPSFPAAYFGNLVLRAYPRLRVKDLLNQNYKFVVKTINEVVAKVDGGYFQSLIDSGKLKKGKELQQSAVAVGNMLSPNSGFTSVISVMTALVLSFLVTCPLKVCCCLCRHPRRKVVWMSSLQ